MWIIIDKRIPENSKNILSKYGEIIEFESKGVVYDSISGHPDVFMCQLNNRLIIAPNTPEKFIAQLKDRKIDFEFGVNPLGDKYPKTAVYNALITNKYLIHNTTITDKSILNNCKEKTIIHSNQAYTRCNLISLDDNSFITSDKGIEKALNKHQFSVLYFNPKRIYLQGFNNGFIGGCCGIINKTLFINGSLEHYSGENNVRKFITSSGFFIIELYTGILYDSGGIFFLSQ